MMINRSNHEDLVWSESDNEEDREHRVETVHNTHRGMEKIVYKDIDIKNKLNTDDRILEKKQRHIFDGGVQLDDPYKPLLPREEPIQKVHEFDVALPYIPQHIWLTLGEDTCCNLWEEFLDYDADESEMVLTKYIPVICDNMLEIHLSECPFHMIKEKMDAFKDDYVEYREIITMLSGIMNQPGYQAKKEVEHIAHPHCCNCEACIVRNGPNARKKTERPAASKAAEHCVNVVFNRLKNEMNGNIRHKDIPALLEECNIPFSLNLLPKRFMELRGEYLISNAQVLDDFIERIRLDREDDMPEEEDYAIPKWLRMEFTASELMLFTHQFKVIDLDKSGAIEAEELIMLTEMMGGRISMQEADDLVAAYDVDRSGTIDFGEFLMLMFKIKNGTINLEDNILAKAMIEAKSQLKIFDEIEAIQNDPPEFCKVHHYGGSPLCCFINIENLVGTPYEGGCFELQIVFHDGYPYRMPNVYFKKKIYSIHVMPQLGGQSIITHLKHIWTGSWNIRQLLTHITGFLYAPDINLLPSRFREPVLEYSRMHERIEYTKQMYKKELDDFGHNQTEERKIQNTLEDEKASLTQLQDFIESFPRLEQMYLNIVIHYLINPDQYWYTAIDWVQQYAVPEVEEDQGAAKQEKNEAPEAKDTYLEDHQAPEDPKDDEWSDEEI